MKTATFSYETRTSFTIKELHSAISDAAKELESYTISARRHLHMYPELSWQEEETIAFIKRELEVSRQDSPFQFDLVEKEGGLWIDLIVDENAPYVLFRADIDALPIQEENENEFVSKIDGVMHACGHDCHTAMLLAAFKALASGMVIPKCNVRFVFQRAEEIGGDISGGSLLVKDGICDQINHAYCLHISGRDSPGHFFGKPGMKFCNPTTIDIEIKASGGHVSAPFRGTNTIDVMTSILSELRGIERLFFPPSEALIFIPTIIHSGTASNVRPSKARIVFALRHFLSDANLELFIDYIRKKVEAITSTYKNTTLSEFTVKAGYPILINDPRSTRFVSSCLTAFGFATDPDNLSFAGDDFAYYLQKVKGSYWVLGAWQEECLDHHTAKFNPDESVLWKGVAFWLLLASRIPI